jgi:hypothetical protein
VTATAREIAMPSHNALRHGMDHADPGTAYYEERRRRLLANLQRRTQSLGPLLQKSPVAPPAAGPQYYGCG